MLAAGSIATRAVVGFAANANADAAPAEAACFGQVHKPVDAGGVEGFDNVGQLVKALGGGRAKNALASSLCGWVVPSPPEHCRGGSDPLVGAAGACAVAA
jgi:hypothetical protein